VRPLCAPAIVVLLLLAAGSALRAQKELTYRDVVGKYRAGEHEAAVKELNALRPSKMDDERRVFERTPFGTLQPNEVKAAVMLHTEAHFQSASGDMPSLPSPHLDRARRLARRCLELLDAAPTADLTEDQRRARDLLDAGRGREFVRQWYLLLASQFQGKRHVSRSAHYLQEARFLFPADPDVLLASGSHHEMLTFVPTGRVSMFDERGENIADYVVDYPKERAEASHYFRAALGANPAMYEAQLRLGRMLYLLGDLAAAATELDAVRARANIVTFRSLAALFLALIEEERGHLGPAARLYVEATKLSPEAQAPYVGISELLYVDGQPDKAAETIMTLLERPAPRDPWWAYMMGEWWHFDARLQALRAQARE
jgi:hypothetical protein